MTRSEVANIAYKRDVPVEEYNNLIIDMNYEADALSTHWLASED